jgi:hypothetical protein
LPRRAALEVVEDGVAALRIDADGGLVEMQHVGIVHERAAMLRRRFIPPLKVCGCRLRAIGQADELRAPRDALAQQRPLSRRARRRAQVRRAPRFS